MCGRIYVGRMWVTWAVLIGGLLVPGQVVLSQEKAGDTAAPAAASAAAPADEAASPTSVEAPPATGSESTPGLEIEKPTPAPELELATNAAKSDDAESEPATTPPDTASPTTTAPTTTDQAPETQGPAPAGGSVILILTIVALVVIPVLIGNYLSKLWSMPDHAWKFSLVLFVLAAASLIVMFGKFKFGPDLAGGITLVYELADKHHAGSPTPDGKAPPEGNAASPRGKGDAQSKIPELITALKERIDPAQTREITVRQYGQDIEIIIPKQAQDELDYIKRKITDVGQLEFRITATDKLGDKERAIVELAKLAPPAQKEIYQDGKLVAEWVNYSTKEFPPSDDRLIRRMAGDVPEALVLIDQLNVTGDYLSSVNEGMDQRGGPAVNFSFDRRGAAGFRLLTSQNKPLPSGAMRNLGIVLDKRLISAPNIRETISDHGQISGGEMDRAEVQYIIGILKAGALPASLNKTPISEAVVSPTLGKVTIEKGEQAIFWSMVAVIVFMIIYYRFAGIVACIALSFNLLLVLALMISIEGAFTLPGLAGLVLTIGMAVDANVLIYERIREELQSGASLRRAIHNGFSRAMSAIIDSNVTTIISGIALYVIGTDQVKGFAVTLVLGIITSMFTAIFVARVIFDVAERRGWITNLRMMKLMSKSNYDFLGKRWWAIGASMVLIAIGLFAAVSRGSQLFDIDFVGGSSITFTLRAADKMPIAEVEQALRKTDLEDKNLTVVERSETGSGHTSTRYSVDTSEKNLETVRSIIQETFGNKLLTYDVKIDDVKPLADAASSGTEAKVTVNEGPEFSDDDGISYEALRERLRNALKATGHEKVQPLLSAPGYKTGSSARYKEWTVQFAGLDADQARAVFTNLQSEMNGTPLFPMASTIGTRVSGDMQSKAVAAVVVSLIGVVIYLWLRFQKVSYGLAAAIAVAHDVLVTIGMMALSYYIVLSVPALASFLQIDAFQINLTIIAAFLTIIGYSLNDTIVTFDRLREIKGKSPQLTPEMVNESVNQCLSRTILTALTVFLTVVILYFFGGDGIHSFAFAFLVGVIAGTYSTVYIAAPVLLWLSGQKITAIATPTPRVIERAG